MISLFSFLATAFFLGLSGGLSPGPLLTLVVVESLKHGVKEGIKVSIAPLFTDTPIVLTTLLLLSRLSDIQPVLGAIALLGAAFLIFLGCESLLFKGVDIDVARIKPQSVKKGIIANFLNPSPYLFWLSIGAPLVLRSYKVSLLSAILFVICFYTVLVGSKILIAVMIGKSRRFLKSSHYVYTIRLLGIILFVFAFFFIKDGLRSWGLTFV
jgi:threonine/homoserine/homoserine lactone efflux protein